LSIYFINSTPRVLFSIGFVISEQKNNFQVAKNQYCFFI